MIVSDAELTGLATISGGGRLPGIPVTSSGREQAMLAMEGLRAKGVVDEQGSLTPFGLVPVRAVEQYREADRHVFINQLKVSLNSDGALTVLHPAPGGWDVVRVNPLELMLVLLRSYPFLCSGGSEDAAGSWQALTVKQWAAGRLKGGASPVLAVRATCVSQCSSILTVYDVRDGAGFAYDFDKKLGQVLPPWQIRVGLAELLGCALPPGDGGSDE